MIYSGGWRNGKREGQGSFFKHSDVVYIGLWKDDKPNGKGQYLNSEGDMVFEGEWKNGYGEIEEGIWLYYEDGKKCGLYENGDRKYEGEWKDGKPDGKGILFDRKGNKKYEGEWKNGMIEIEKGIWFDYSLMECEVKDNNGNIVYKGEWENGKPEGKGKLYGKENYEGEWNEGVLEIGNCTYVHYDDKLVHVTYIDGKMKYEGEWKNGKPEGKGVWYDEKGNMKYDGEWKNGYYHIKGSLWFNYNANKEQKVVALERSKTQKKYKNCISIEEVADYATSQKAIKRRKVMKVVTPILAVLALALLVFVIYVLSVFLNPNPVMRSCLDLHLYNKWIKTLTINQGCCNDTSRSLIISNHPNLERIIVNVYSLRYVNYLSIDNNPVLQTIQIESDSQSNAPFYFTYTVIFSSIVIIHFS